MFRERKANTSLSASFKTYGQVGDLKDAHVRVVGRGDLSGGVEACRGQGVIGLGMGAERGGMRSPSLSLPECDGNLHVALTCECGTLELLVKIGHQMLTQNRILESDCFRTAADKNVAADDIFKLYLGRAVGDDNLKGLVVLLSRQDDRPRAYKRKALGISTKHYQEEEALFSRNKMRRCDNHSVRLLE